MSFVELLLFKQYHVWDVLLCCISAGYNCKTLTDWVSTLPAVTVCVSQHAAHTLTCRVPPQVAAAGRRRGSGDVAVQSSRQDPLQFGPEGTNTFVHNSECLAHMKSGTDSQTVMFVERQKTAARWNSVMVVVLQEGWTGGPEQCWTSLEQLWMLL